MTSPFNNHICGDPNSACDAECMERAHRADLRSSNSLVPDRERDAFEAWALDKFSLHRNPRDPSRYLMETPAIAWNAWQARADLAIRESATLAGQARYLLKDQAAKADEIERLSATIEPPAAPSALVATLREIAVRALAVGPKDHNITLDEIRAISDAAERLAQPPSDGDADRADWRFVAQTLEECRTRLQVGGSRLTWIDPAIDIARTRCGAVPAKAEEPATGHKPGCAISSYLRGVDRIICDCGASVTKEVR